MNVEALPEKRRLTDSKRADGQERQSNQKPSKEQESATEKSLRITVRRVRPPSMSPSRLGARVHGSAPRRV